VLQRLLENPGRHLCQNLQQISLHQVRLSHATRHITTVQLPVGELEPFSQVFETDKGIVSEGIGAIIAYTTKLHAR
jgi:hypothetical protein